MIKVFVVDDEKLVRRGIIGLIDWEKYGMQVVGDAGNGADALDFLRREDVDLLFSDLEMPGLSGIPFLQKAKEVRPNMKIVVLTMHQEFEMIQQALRLGILDYVTKAQIEEENIDTLMTGIQKRYMGTMNHSRLEQRKVSTAEIFVWETAEEDGKRVAELLGKNHFSYELLNDTHLMIPGDCNSIRLKNLLENFDGRECTLLELKQVKDVSCDELEDRLSTVVKWQMFKDRVPGCAIYSYVYPNFPAVLPDISRKELTAFSTRMEFMVDQECYEKGLAQIRDAVLTGEERTATFYQFNLYWSEFSGKDISRYFEEVEDFRWWYQWREWFDGVRRLVLERMGGADEEITSMEAIHKAMNYIREHMDREIPLEELLKLTGMSKSHFSKNFKKITGKTFVTYLNDMRIDTAKKYLTETKQSVYWIAGQVGYADEHYFRRVFKEKTGKSPNKFREDVQNVQE